MINGRTVTTDPDKTRFVCRSRTSTGMNPVCGRQHGGATCPAGDSLCKSAEADRLPLRFRRAGVERESFFRLKWWRQISCIDTRHPLPCIVGFHPPLPPSLRGQVSSDLSAHRPPGLYASCCALCVCRRAERGFQPVGPPAGQHHLPQQVPEPR